MRTPQLEEIAKRVTWWKPAEESLKDTSIFLCRVMTFGLWSDAVYVLQTFGEDALRDALRNPPPGVFDEASWNYWHHRLGIHTIPALPVRRFDENTVALS